jgi:methionine sulfoxide reductase heme-binding subunit
MRALMALFQGWNLVIATFVGVGAMFAGIFIAADGSAEALGLIIRITVRPALVFFGLAFSAAALVRLWPNAFTRWQIKNRRYLGLSFATSHFMHAAALAVWGVMYPDEFLTRTNIGIWIGGGIGYAFILAMSLTSFDSALRWMGARKWSLLHTTGSYYLWFVFTLGSVGRSLADPFYYSFLAFMVSMLAVRVWARFANRRTNMAAA